MGREANSHQLLPFVARVTMGDEISEGAAKGKAAGGAKAGKAAKVHREFWQATSLVANMPAVTTGDTLQFSHGQRSGMKGTPSVNGVLPGTYTEGAAVIQHWDGVNLFKYYSTQPDNLDEGLQKCGKECEGDAVTERAKHIEQIRCAQELAEARAQYENWTCDRLLVNRVLIPEPTVFASHSAPWPAACTRRRPVRVTPAAAAWVSSAARL